MAPALGWIIPELARIQAEHNCLVVVDGGGPTADLIPAMEAAGINLKIAKTNDVKDACAGIFNRVQDKTSPILGTRLSTRLSPPRLNVKWATGGRGLGRPRRATSRCSRPSPSPPGLPATDAYDVMNSAW
jgi:hypothetical protein